MKTYPQRQFNGNPSVDRSEALQDQEYTVRLDPVYSRNVESPTSAQSRKTPKRNMNETQWGTYNQNSSNPLIDSSSNVPAQNQWSKPRRGPSCAEESHTGSPRHKHRVSLTSMSTFEIGQTHLNQVPTDQNAGIMTNADAAEISWEAQQMGSNSRTDIAEQLKNFDTGLWDMGDYAVLPSRASPSSTLPSDFSGADSLQKACFHGRTAVVSLLLTNGASLVRKNSRGQTALHLAASQGHASILKLLLSSSKSKRNSHNLLTHALDDTGLAPLHLASLNGHCAAVRVLLSTNTGNSSRLVDMTDHQGRTPLHIAAEEGHVDVVQSLLESGTRINARMTSGLTALHAASERGHDAVVRLLLEWGADAEARSADG